MKTFAERLDYRSTNLRPIVSLVLILWLPIPFTVLAASEFLSVSGLVFGNLTNAIVTIKEELLADSWLGICIGLVVAAGLFVGILYLSKSLVSLISKLRTRPFRVVAFLMSLGVLLFLSSQRIYGYWSVHSDHWDSFWTQLTPDP